MKTNQIMIRRMGDFKVIQRTKDAFFNATDLLKQWNQLKGMKKEVKDYLENYSTSELVKTIKERENFTSGNSPYVKSKASRGENAGTWMHPFNATDLLKQWNEQIDNQSILNTQKIGVLKRKDLDNYLNSRNSAYLSSREKNGLGEFSPKIDNQVVIRI